MVGFGASTPKGMNSYDISLLCWDSEISITRTVCRLGFAALHLLGDVNYLPETLQNFNGMMGFRKRVSSGTS